MAASGDRDSVLGRWFSINGDQGIVRFVGPVDGAKGEWLGVEWDNPARGKHSGAKDGKHYFKCQKPGPCGSFIRNVERISWGQTLLSAARTRYIADIDKVSQILPTSIDGHKGRIEAVGFDKVSREQSDLRSLKVFGLDSQMVFGLGDRRETEELMANAQTLTLANNYLTQWGQVEEIIQALPSLHTLDVSANHFGHPLHVSTSSLGGSAHVHTLRIDTSPNLAWSDVAQIAQQLSLTALSFGWSRLSGITTPVGMGSVEELHVEYNDISDISPLAHMPRLRILSLSGNARITSIPAISAGMFPALEALNISHTQISTWRSIENLSAIPKLHTLYATGTPLAEAAPVGSVQNESKENIDTISSMRAQVIGRLGNLRKLDGTVITAEERTEMERYYLAQCAKAAASQPGSEASGVSGDDVLTQLMADKYPRIHELVGKHGPPRISKSQESRLKSRLIKVAIEVVRGDDLTAPAETTAERSLIRTMQVRQLRPIVMRLARAQQGFRLYARSDGDQWTHLDNDARPLSYFGLESGSTIRALIQP